jgi:S1-C subfamily serine protease
VIEEMDEIKVQLNDGRTEPATLIGTDPQTDIAVLKIHANNLTPLPLGDSDQVKVGQMAFAIGNPLGLQETVTRGIISARRRPVEDSTMEYFQTDAAINPGNSGGPLVNLRGEIIGINTWIASQTGGSQGLGFAVPANAARRVLEGVLKNGRMIHGYLGVGMQPLTTTLAQQLGLDSLDGVLIVGAIPGSPAQKSGLRTGDVVKKFDGKPVRNVKEFQSLIAAAEVGANVKLGIIRQQKETTLDIVLAERPDDSVSVQQ